jgi:hypothetical protein
MVILIIIIVTLLYLSSIYFRLLLLNFFSVLKYSFFDIIKYSRYKNIPKKPFINVYVGLFGQGKTLSAVHDCINFYYQYNNKRVYDDRFKRWTTQKVMILSNVHLNNVPYRYLHNLHQLNLIAKTRHLTDKRKNQRTITIALIDEASTCFNSREFRSNISPTFLRTLLCSRHSLIHGFYLTSQRFSHMDALLRQVSSNVIECKKFWRFQKLTFYDAWTYENAASPAAVTPVSSDGFFVSDKDYAAYDTLAVVQALIKDQEDGKMISSQEELEKQGSKTIINAADPGGKKRKRKK